MLKIGLGTASRNSSYKNGVLAATRALEQCPDPDAALVIAGSGLEASEVFAGIKSVIAEVPLIGTSSYHETSNLGLVTGSVTVLLMRSEDIEFTVMSHPVTTPVKTAEKMACEYLAAHEGLSGSRVSCLLFGDQKHEKGADYLKGLDGAFPFPVPVSGGGSAGRLHPVDMSELTHGWQYATQGPTRDNLGLLFMKSSDVNTVFSYSFESSFTPVAPPVLCTRASGNIVFEVDGLSILDYLASCLGQDYLKLLGEADFKYQFITSLTDGSGDAGLVISPQKISAASEGVPFFPNVDMSGVTLQLVYMNREEMLQGSRRAAEKALEALDGANPEMVLVISCGLRYLLLLSRVSEEIDMVRSVFGPHVPIVGGYCAGEYGPLYSRYSEVTDRGKSMHGSRQLSCSISIMVIGSRAEKANGISQDYEKLLKRFEEFDSLGFRQSEYERLAVLEERLCSAEAALQSTERTLRNLNRAHFELGQELKSKNEALEQSNTRNEMLRSIIERYTPKNVFRKAWRSVDMGTYSIPDEEWRCVMMFLDIKGFTSFADCHDARSVIREISRIFSPIVDLIYSAGGDIDKFIGDCIFAVFENENAAIECGLEVQRMMKSALADSPFSLRIGINSGRVISGNVGNDTRMDNTLIGDAVNLAQRMEANCTPGCILITDQAFEAVDSAVAQKLNLTRKKIMVKGKSAEISVVEIVCS
ncbi:MAG: adenylate/guanylate cyclase domain-containing protein [Candidatus Wallbacteria bacterium]|nr:adenylate/guanylate cyclase domain-containing protein [Candidatus Wallbacteria bacterium]